MLDPIIARLKQGDVSRVFEAHRVRLGYLFGSRARGTARPGSDVDVAVLLPGSMTRVERVEMGAALEHALHRMLGLPVQIVVLNDANAAVRFEAVIRGVGVLVPRVEEEMLLEKQIRMQFEDLQHAQRIHMREYRRRLGLEP